MYSMASDERHRLGNRRAQLIYNMSVALVRCGSWHGRYEDVVGLHNAMEEYDRRLHGLILHIAAHIG